jgi:hypothetical protein
MVDNIPSGTVKNKIGRNLKESGKIAENFDKLKAQYTGKILINEIYKEAYGIDLGLDNFIIKTEDSGDENGVIYFNNRW